METDGTVTVRMFGRLYSARREAGLPTCVDAAVPAAGVEASQLARSVGLDPRDIEGVFVNRVVRDLGHVVLPGDRVAYIPPGTPGPHRFFLGIYSAGKREAGCSTDER